MSALAHHTDPLTEIKAALDFNPFADPVTYQGRALPRARARAIERHLQGVRRGVVA